MSGFRLSVVPLSGGMWVGALEDYKMYMVAAGCAPTTIRLKLHYLDRLARVLPAGPWTATEDDLVRFLGHRPDWKPETRKSARATLRTFYEWAFVTERMTTNPAARLPSVKVPEGMPRPTPLALVRKALSDADARSRLMVNLAVFAGLRCHEIAQVHTDDLVDDLIGTSLRVVGKGKRTRMIPLDEQLADELRALPPGLAFPGRVEGHISADRVGEIIAGLLGRGWTAHTLRHRFATSAYAADRDLFAVQKLLGHASPMTTVRYTAIPDESLRAAVNGVRSIVAA